MHNQLKDIEDNNNDGFSEKIEDLGYNNELKQSSQCSAAKNDNNNEIDDELTLAKEIAERNE